MTRKLSSSSKIYRGTWRFLSSTLLLALLISACGSDDPNNQADLRVKRSQAYQKQSQYRAALIEARTATKLVPGRTDAQLQLALVYNRLGHYNSTLESLEDTDFTGNPDLILTRAAAYNALRKHRSALQLLESNSESITDEHLGQYQFIRGEALIGLGSLEKGRQSLQHASTGTHRTQAMLSMAQLDALTDASDNSQLIIAGLLSQHPRDARVWLVAGKITAFQGRYEQAEDYLSEALSLLPRTDIMLPERIDTLQTLSRVMTMRGHPEESLIYNKLLVDNVPQYMENRDRIAESFDLIEAGQLEEAEVSLRSLLEAGGNNYAGTLLGIVNYLQGDIGEASPLLSAHLDPETANSQAIELLVDAKFQLNEMDQVLSILGPDIRSRTDNPDLLGLYGLAKLAHQDPTGVEDIKRSLELQPDNSKLRLVLVPYFQQQGESDKSLQQAQIAYTQDTDSHRAQGTLMQQSLLAEKPSETRNALEEIAKSNNADADTLTLVGMTYIRLGDPDRAWHYLQKAVELDPENADAWLTLADLAMGDRDYKAAETYFKYAVDILPHAAIAYKGIIDTWEAREEQDKAIQLLREYTERDTTNGIPLTVSAEYLLRHGAPKKAMQSIEAALERQQGNTFINHVAIAIYSSAAKDALLSARKTEASDIISRGLSQLPGSSALLKIKAHLALTNNQIGVANDIAASLEDQDPAAALVLQGDILRSTDTHQAIEAYRASWELDPTSDSGRKLYSLLHEADPKDAEAFKTEWKKRRPNDPDLLFMVAVEEQNQSRPEAAARNYEKILTQDPLHVAAINNLAWLYYEKEDGRALELAQRAVKLAPNNPAVLDTYGMVLLASGQQENAKKILSKAQQLDPQSAQIKQHLDLANKQ